jgi:uncharacterized protein with HEPN domain
VKDTSGSSERDLVLFLEDVLESIARVEEYTAGMNAEQFAGSPLVQDAVLRRIAVMGEAVKHVPELIRGRYPDVEWRKIAGMRDVLIHGYFGVDLDLAWSTVR